MGAFQNAPGAGGSGDWALNLLFQTLLLGYIAIAVVNTLVMATAARVREFAMLQLIGASRDQVRAMMNGEARIVVFSALLFGLLATIPPLVGISISLTKSPVPRVSPSASSRSWRSPSRSPGVRSRWPPSTPCGLLRSTRSAVASEPPSGPLIPREHAMAPPGHAAVPSAFGTGL